MDTSTVQEGAAARPIQPEGTPQPTTTPRTTRSLAHLSFLDFSSSSSSSGRDGSSRDKSEPRSPPSDIDQPGQNVRPPDERSSSQEEDRRTFGQRTERSSFYYNSLDIPLPSPSDSSHQSYQSYQSQAQEGQRPSSWSHQRRRHASWRTFGGRIEGDIPEEVSPLESSVPFAPAEVERGDVPSELPIEQTPSSIQQNQPPPLPVPPQGTITQDTDEPGRGGGGEIRTSYQSTSSGGYAHIHPLPAGFDIQQPHPYTIQPSALQMGQIEPTSPSTDDEASPSPIAFRTGGVRRTSSGDVQPVTYSRHRRHNGGSSSSGSGSDLRPQRHPQHPFGIP